MGILQLKGRRVKLLDIPHFKYVHRNFEDCCMGEKGLVVSDRDTLKNFMHIDRQTAVPKGSSFFPFLIVEQGALNALKSIIPCKKSIPSKERIDDCLCSRAEEFLDDIDITWASSTFHRSCLVLDLLRLF